jgi:hypothetical protein
MKATLPFAIARDSQNGNRPIMTEGGRRAAAGRNLAEGFDSRVQPRAVAGFCSARRVATRSRAIRRRLTPSAPRRCIKGPVLALPGPHRGHGLTSGVRISNRTSGNFPGGPSTAARHRQNRLQVGPQKDQWRCQGDAFTTALVEAALPLAPVLDNPGTTRATRDRRAR